jgi:PII-like signaling protein
MTTITRCCRLSVYLGNADTHRHHALSAEILHRAHRFGIRGATTLQGVQGYGHSTTIHRTPRWALTNRTPVTVHIIDIAERIRRFLPELDDLADQCLIVCDEVDVMMERSLPEQG